MGAFRPPGRLRHDRGHPLLAGLFSDWVTQPDISGGVWQNLYGGAPLVPDTANTVAASSLQHGPATHNTSGYSRLVRSSASLWNPQAAGGYAPATLMWFGAVDALQQSGSNVFSIGSTDANRIAIANSVGTWTGLIGLGGTTRVLTTTLTMFTGAVVYAVIMTTRSATDHQFYARRLDTGDFATATSSASVGSAGAVSAEVLGGAFAYAASFRTSLKTMRALALNRGLSTQEAVALLGEPWAGLAPERTFYGFSPVTEVLADLDETLGALTLQSTVSLQNNAALDVTLGGLALVATASVPVIADSDVTLGDLVLDSAAVQSGAGASAVVGEALGALDLDASVALAVVGDVSETLAPLGLVSFAAAGAVGPFAPRPVLRLN